MKSLGLEIGVTWLIQSPAHLRKSFADTEREARRHPQLIEALEVASHRCSSYVEKKSGSYRDTQRSRNNAA